MSAAKAPTLNAVAPTISSRPTPPASAHQSTTRSRVSRRGASSPAVRRRGSAPCLGRDLDQALELAPLHVLGDLVALDGRREAALRADRELLHRHVAGCLVDPALERVLALDLRLLRGHDAEHDLL